MVTDKPKQADAFILTNLQKVIHVRKIKFVIVILSQATIFIAYFFGFHYLSSDAFTRMSKNITIMNSLFFRQSTVENGFIGVIESYSRNYTPKIYGKGDKLSDQIDYYVTRMYEEEKAYQKNIIDSKHP
jgi:hypothetical protein